MTKQRTTQRTTQRTRRFPSDPERMNAKRSIWAGVAVAAFQSIVHGDDNDAVKDLLADLMHYCDRNGEDFDTALDAARYHYTAETTAAK